MKRFFGILFALSIVVGAKMVSANPQALAPEGLSAFANEACTGSQIFIVPELAACMDKLNACRTHVMNYLQWHCEFKAPHSLNCSQIELTDAKNLVSADKTSIQQICNVAEFAPDACGNGKLDPGEVCDDSNQDDTDLCINHCQTKITAFWNPGSHYNFKVTPGDLPPAVMIDPTTPEEAIVEESGDQVPVVDNAKPMVPLAAFSGGGCTIGSLAGSGMSATSWLAALILMAPALIRFLKNK